MKRLFTRTLVLVGLTPLFTACSVQKKIQELTLRYETELAKVRDDYYAAQKEINQLNLTLAERKGENNELVRVQDKLQAQIDALEMELQRRNNQAMVEKMSLSQLLSAKDSTVAVQQGRIGTAEQVILQSYRELDSVASILRDSMQSLPAGSWKVEIIDRQVILRVQESILFKAGATSKLEVKGIDVLRAFSTVLTAYPLLFVQVTGHHDNQPLPKKSPIDTWDFTALRASTVAKVLSRELEVDPRRITAAGKGAFLPVESNESPEGQAKNRRIELALFHASDELPKKLLQVFQQ